MPTDSSNTVPVVEVLSADKVFANGTRALSPINLTIQPGEFITLLGIGYVFQDATLMPWSRVQNNVRLPLDLAGDDRAQADAKVAAALELVGLKGFENHYPRQLSGGMQMRASIARSLVTEPNLLLMDEPFGALDEITRNKLDADIIQLWWRKKLTVIFVTHSIYEAVFLSTRVIVMAARPGRVLKEVLIDEPHPRTDAFRVTQKFAAYAKELSELLAQASASGASDL